MLRPSLMFLCSLAAAQSPDEILKQAREKLNQFTPRLPKFACTETINREYFKAESALVDRNLCPIVMPKTEGRLPYLTDRLRLEVTVENGREIHAWPGASEFDLRNIDEIVSGPISTGAFGTYLIELFNNAGTRITFIRENAGELLEFAYRTPIEASHYHVSKLRKLTAHGGTFQIHRPTLELVNLIIETDPLPPESEMCLDRTAIDFQRGAERPTAQQSLLTILNTRGVVSRTRTTFSDCREFGAKSTIRFGEEGTPEAQRAAAKEVGSIPAGIRFSFRNSAMIDFDTAAIGDRISGRVNRTSDKNRLPEDSVVTGRIIQLRQYPTIERTEIAFKLERILIRGIPHPLSAVPDRGSNFAGGSVAFQGAARPRAIATGRQFAWITSQ